MAINIRNAQVERLADELSNITGESRTATILHALEERRERIARGAELTEGMTALAEARTGKRTLRTHVIKDDTKNHVEELCPGS